ncbi:MAG TPA: hypothetical protein PK299_10325 [Anaerolineales bacterium]|nr:hypothetical protein [Anaerolineales bacterium]
MSLWYRFTHWFKSAFTEQEETHPFRETAQVLAQTSLQLQARAQWLAQEWAAAQAQRKAAELGQDVGGVAQWQWTLETLLSQRQTVQAQLAELAQLQEQLQQAARQAESQAVLQSQQVALDRQWQALQAQISKFLENE